MSDTPKIRAHTRYSFISIGLMLAVFLLFAMVSIVPLGLTPAQQIAVIRLLLYMLVLFAVLGGAFSLRVALLRKSFER